jgi:hypothetical protein
MLLNDTSIGRRWLPLPVHLTRLFCLPTSQNKMLQIWRWKKNSAHALQDSSPIRRMFPQGTVQTWQQLMANSHIACHAHAVPLPCLAVNSHMPCRAPVLLRQCHVLRESPCGSRKYSNCQSNSLTDRLFCSVLLPLFTVVGMDRCEEKWYASDNNLRGTPCGSRKYPNC